MSVVGDGRGVVALGMSVGRGMVVLGVSANGVGRGVVGTRYGYGGHECVHRIHIHCKKSMVILTNKNGYLSCTFVLSTLGTEQRYKECARCVGYYPGGIER